MFNSQFIEVGIGLVFVFLLMSIMVSGLNEMIAAIFDHRGKHLKDAIDTALEDTSHHNLSNQIYNHPLIDTLKKTEKKLPAYISSAVFAKSLIDTIAKEAGSAAQNTILQSKSNPIHSFTEGVNALKDGNVKFLFASFVSDAQGDYDKLKVNIENWYNEYMNRVSGWYKKRVKLTLFTLGLVFAICMNVDTVHISKALWENTVLRQSVANAADGFASLNKDSTHMKPDTTFEMQIQKIRSGYAELGMLNLPIGWNLNSYEKNWLADKAADKNFTYYLSVLKIYSSKIGLTTLIGWLFTGFAISFGAPMWFDMLNKLINLRHSVKGK